MLEELLSQFWNGPVVLRGSGAVRCCVEPDHNVLSLIYTYSGIKIYYFSIPNLLQEDFIYMLFR